jgi:hypothetical protein
LTMLNTDWTIIDYRLLSFLLLLGKQVNKVQLDQTTDVLEEADENTYNLIKKGECKQ